MKVVSNFLLNAAVFTRRVPPVFQLCIRGAFRVRQFERKHWPSPEEIAEREKDERDARLSAVIRARIPALIAASSYDQDVTPVQEFERTLLNGSFKLTPKLRTTIREGVRLRRTRGVKGPILVVVNKTNTIVSLGLGKLGNEGGVCIPKVQPNGVLDPDPEPFFLSDRASKAEWIKSPDFRNAIAKGWIKVLRADGK